MYRVKVGINVKVDGHEVRHEPGKVVDLPPALAKVWIADGTVEEVFEPKKAPARKKV